MPVRARLRKCLEDLTEECDQLQATNEALVRECFELREQLANLKPLEFPLPGDAWQPVEPQSAHPPGLAVTDIEEPGGNKHMVDVCCTLPEAVSSEPVESDGQREPKKDGALLPTNGTRADTSKLHKQQTVKTMGAARLGYRGEEEEDAHTQLLRASNFSVFFSELFKDGDEYRLAHYRSQARVFRILQKVVQSVVFRSFCLAVIIVNCIYASIRINSDLVASRKRATGELFNHEDSSDSHVVQICFLVWFIVELSLRAFVERKNFFTGKHRAYNLLDAVAILLELINTLGSTTGATSAFPGGTSIFRIMRVFRAVRIARLMDAVSPLRYLRTMLFAIANSFTCLIWAVVLMILSIFLFSMVLGSTLTYYFENVNTDSPDEVLAAQRLSKSFGSIYLTMISMFASVTGGQDWMNYADELRNLPNGEAYFVFYSFFIFFCLIGMLNVINGMFVDAAVCTRTEDEMIQQHKRDVKSICEQIGKIFDEGDGDASGSITLDELKEQMKNPWVKAYFAGLDIDTREASIIFTLADSNRNGELSIAEFATGVLKMKGAAKGVDVLTLMFDHYQLSQSFQYLCGYLQDEIGLIKQALVPDSPPRDLTEYINNRLDYIKQTGTAQ
eukprot:TRINITY_DN90705_c0_g1_i1.p1 TRINITY_DN90705_c0_g1~~TRINITY_DN90705_c0_g1_i1.p1  ORF type:complete len:625 (+),score=111.90 TRINITY_DN90705_c0_g1_i1:27-1877(+)